MMTDPNFYLTMATTSLAALAMLTVAGLTGWRGWLGYKHQQLLHIDSPQGQSHGLAQGMMVPNASARIEIADLKERLRKLEAIAAGVDL